jgi:hypothetical protein
MVRRITLHTGSALDRMLDCTAATVDPICDDLYSMARCKLQVMFPHA